MASNDFNSLFTAICSDRFQNKEGLGNEVPFFIYSFDPKDQFAIDAEIVSLIKKLEKNGVGVLEVNLFDLAVEVIQGRKYWERIMFKEASLPKDRFMQQMSNLTKPYNEKLVPAIKSKMDSAEFKVMFITGVGLVYPFIEIASLLNNMQSIAKDKPTLIFIPGEYTYNQEGGMYINLFGQLERKYYRAFSMNDYQL